MSAQAAVEKWLRNSGNAATSYREAIGRVTESPMERAAARADHWQQRVSDPRIKDRYVAGLRRTTLEEWKKRSAEVGSPRYTQGVQAAAPRFRAFFEAFYPLTQEVRARVRAMPKATEEDAIQRVRTVISAFKAFRR